MAGSGGVGDLFQDGTKYRRDLAREGREPGAAPPPSPGPAGSRGVPLPPPASPATAPLWKILRDRRSIREFAAEGVGLAAVSFLLWACAGLRDGEGRGRFRTTPSAGALYPIETWLVAHQVAGLEKGIYRYVTDGHLLREVSRGDFGQPLARAAMWQSFCADGAAVFVWTAVFARTTGKYGQRGYRYVYLDAGHAAQNLLLAATALGLGGCPLAAFFDDEVNLLLRVDGVEESAIYMAAVGRAR